MTQAQEEAHLLMKTAECAEYLTEAGIEVTEATLRQWQHRRRGPESFKFGNRRYYRREVVDTWLAELGKAS